MQRVHVFLAWASLAMVAPLAHAAAGTPPNVLLIVVDDLNNWIGAMGGKAQTPNIDRLAGSGMLFTNAHCVTPACNPSRVAMLTGMRPETTGQFSNEGNFRQLRTANEAIATLPQHFRSHGYEAVAAGKIFHHPRGAGERPNPLSDPVSWDEQRRGATGTPGSDLYTDSEGFALWHEGVGRSWKNTYAAKACYWGPIPQTKEETGDWATATYCAEYLTRTHEKPFVLACGIFRPHSPQLAPREYFDRYPLDSIELPERPPDDMDDIPAPVRTNWSSPLVAEMKKRGLWKQAVQAYLASTTFADDCIGVVLDALERSPHRDTTIVVFVTDHGWHLGTKNRWEKFSLWHAATNSPLVIRAPGLPSGTCERAVSLLDIYPTLVDLAGLPAAPGLEGISLRPWLQNPAAPRDTPAIMTYPQGSHGVAWENWNYIRYADGSEELYDHTTDPNEWNNLASDPALAARKAALAQHLESLAPTR